MKKRRYYKEYLDCPIQHIITKRETKEENKSDLTKAKITIAFIVIGFATACILNYYGG